MSLQPNLNSLTEEVQHYLETEHFIVFRCLTRAGDEAPIVYWDTERHPEFKPFLDCALQLGIRLIHLHVREFTSMHREEALDQLGESALDRNQQREMKRRIEELTIYEGLTCAVEMSFDFEGRLYIYQVHTEWYEEWQDLCDELEDFMGDGEDGPDKYGGYFSNN
ncbi:MAG: hypothetical protein IH602_10895 [Bryobacteraceae bacterium]|jgi:hypothetical protein|nr:hypothetical protein [Bryobacteraceae bacterium]